MKILSLAVILIVPTTLLADEVILRDGRSIEWRMLKDLGESLEVQTTDNRIVTIQKKDVREIRSTAPKSPLTGATFTGDLTKGGAPVNALALVDPKKNLAGGECRIAGGAVVCAGTGLLEIPHIPVGVYDVELTIERRDGEDECHIGLVAGGRPFSVQIDWGKGQCSGLSAIDGRRVYENDTRVNGRLLASRKPRTFICAVRTDRVVILCDGKELIHWKGDPKKLSLESRPEKFQNLFFSWNASSFAVSKYVVTPRKE